MHVPGGEPDLHGHRGLGLMSVNRSEQVKRREEQDVARSTRHVMVPFSAAKEADHERVLHTASSDQPFG